MRHRYVPEDLLGELDRILDMLARVRPEAKEYVAQERPKVLYGGWSGSSPTARTSGSRISLPPTLPVTCPG